MNEQLLRQYIKEHVRSILEKTGETFKIGNHEVELIYIFNDQDEVGAISTVVYKVDNKFLITFQTYGGRNVDEKFYYHIPNEDQAIGVGVKDNLNLAKGVTDEAKAIATREFVEKLADDALFNMTTPFNFLANEVEYGEWGDFF